MKRNRYKHATFIGKSLLWSVLLYVVMMLAANWDDVRTAATSNGMAMVSHVLPVPQDEQKNKTTTATRADVLQTATVLIKTIAGLLSWY